MGVPLEGDVETIATGLTGPEVEWKPSEPTRFPIQAADQNLGELVVFAGGRRLATTDRAALDLMAKELGTVAKTQFLMEQTKLLALLDALTTLYNRRHSNAVLDLEVARTNRYGTPLTLVMCDIDQFKAINDRHGHNVGDEVIRRVAGILASGVRRTDLAGRWGGEEFVVLLPNTGCEGGAVVAERIRTAVEALLPIERGPEKVTISVGVAEHERGKTATDLVERADKALYAAKQRGRNRVELAAQANGQEFESRSKVV
jgi:diguanylate cyclase (GGDEF)-like protein